MINLLKDWKGSIDINDNHFESVEDAIQFVAGANLDDITIKLSTIHANEPVEQPAMSGEHRITVKSYMTKKSSPDFDFMLKWNADNPMPMRTMQGTVVKETRGMVYMKLHGYGEHTITCLCCGKELTNPISRHYGIGPICLSKVGINRDIEDVEGITEELQKIEWEGWIIKSAILIDEIV